MNSRFQSATISGDSTMREVDRRLTSSTIIHEEFLGPIPSASTEPKIVEVQVPNEVRETRVKKIEYIDHEIKVPVTKVEYVDKIVEVPQIEYVDRFVEVPQYVDVVKQVVVKKTVQVPKEVVNYIKRIEPVYIDKVVEVPGPIVDRPVPYTVEKKVAVPRYVDNEVAMVVAQTIRPVITETSETIEVDVIEYEPQVVMVDVQVPKPVPSQLIACGMVEEVHNLVTVPAAQYNSMLKMLNTHITEGEQRQVLPFMREAGGSVPMLAGPDASIMYPAPISTAKIQGWRAGMAGQNFVARTSTTTTTQQGASAHYIRTEGESLASRQYIVDGQQQQVAA